MNYCCEVWTDGLSCYFNCPDVLLVVDDCNEDVASLNELVTDLNEAGDLALFLRSMRRQFKQLV